MKKKLPNIIMFSAEVAPFAKAGGLADVAGSLPYALDELGYDVKMFMPKYGSISEKEYKLKKIKDRIAVKSGNKKKFVSLWEGNFPNSSIKVYFVDHKEYFGKPKIYWGNESERFLFFSLASLMSIQKMGWKADVFHCHDFHTAMISDLVRANKGLFDRTKILYTIHNLGYQGKSGEEILSTGSLNKDSLKSLTKDSRDGDINFMVQGIINSDWVNTVSPTYAEEIQTSIYGAGLERVIKDNKHKLSGILNGINEAFFDPASDELIKYNYNKNSPAKKVKNKTFLQRKFGLGKNRQKPMIGLVSRLTWQKGIDLISEELLDLDAHFVFLGSGAKEYEDYLKYLSEAYPDKLAVSLEFNEELAHRIYAGSDFFLMPSRFEPCGLGQMIAMRYGAIPVVSDTGGLSDTVNATCGFKFGGNEKKDLLRAVKRALRVYSDDHDRFLNMRKRAMNKDFSWEGSAREYAKIYKRIL